LSLRKKVFPAKEPSPTDRERNLKTSPPGDREGNDDSPKEDERLKYIVNFPWPKGRMFEGRQRAAFVQGGRPLASKRHEI